MEIRKATLNDLNRLVEVKKKTWQLNDFCPDVNKYYEYLINDGIAIVVEEKNKIIGFVMGENEKEFSHSYVEDLWVEKNHRKKHIVLMLSERYEAECRKRNIKYLTAHVREDNKEGLAAVYYGAGFTKGEKYYLMMKKLG